jgi:photosystem II stability/assembly factor-like uncharacterized protein
LNKFLKYSVFLSFHLIFIISLNSQWATLGYVNTSQLNSVKFFDQYTGVTCGAGGIWRTTNSGYNWTQVLNWGNLNSISFPNNIIGYAVGDSGRVLGTSTGGQQWTPIQCSQAGNLNLFCTNFVNVATGWIVGQNGIIVYTSNGGIIWSIQTNPLNENLYCIYMLNSTSGFLSGGTSHETYAGTLNGGYNWSFMQIEPGNIMFSIRNFPPLDQIVISTGMNGRIRRSTNLGYSWTLPNSGTTQQLNSLYFTNYATGYIAGDGGTILKTIDSGATWYSEASSTSSNLRSINFLNSNYGWAVGLNGVVIGYGLPAGIINANSEIPYEMKLYQNYPNPFNSSTLIQYYMAHSGYLRISIFDISGKKIKTLLEGNQQSGSHKLYFDGSDLASGIYFYRIEFKDFFKIKKMVLIK